MGYIALGKNCVFKTLRHYKNYIFEVFCLQQATLLDSFQNKISKFSPWAGFLSHFATSCDIITWALQDEIKSFNISKLHFKIVMISKHVKSFK